MIKINYNQKKLNKKQKKINSEIRQTINKKIVFILFY